MCRLIEVALCVIVLVATANCITFKQCEGIANGVYVRGDNGCKSYIHCNGESSFEGSCALDMAFNPEDGSCDDPDNVQCQDEIVKPLVTFVGGVCPMNADDIVYIPSEESCSSYYMCFAGSAISMTCPTSLHFNAQKQTCDFPAKANCKIGGESTTTVENAPTWSTVGSSTGTTPWTTTGTATHTTKTTKHASPTPPGSTKTTVTTRRSPGTTTRSPGSTTTTRSPTTLTTTAAPTTTTGRTTTPPTAGTTTSSPVTTTRSPTTLTTTAAPTTTTGRTTTPPTAGTTTSSPVTTTRSPTTLTTTAAPAPITRSTTTTPTAETTTPSLPTPESTKIAEEQCQKQWVGTFAYPEDCHYYYRCISGAVSRQECPNGFGWDADKKACSASGCSKTNV